MNGKLTGGRREHPYLYYTGMFALILLVILGCFAYLGKSVLRDLDSLAEHGPALAYIGRWIRDGLSGKGWRMVDFTLGQGLDVPTTLMWFGFSDPVSWVSALFPENSLNIVYAIVLFGRAYLAGLFTVMLTRVYGAEDWQASLSGVIYAFSSYMFIAAMKHLNFTPGMMLLPLLFYMIERVFREKKWAGYVLVVTLSFFSNFYFTYKNTILAILYIVVRLIVEIRFGRDVKECAKIGVTLLLGYILGAMMSAVLMLPMVMAFLNTSRTGVASGYQGSMWHYPLSYYSRLFSGMFYMPTEVNWWTIVGAIPLCAFAVSAMVFDRKKEHVFLKIMSALMLILLCIPLVGKIMNGMGYVTNRFSYALQLFIAVGTAIGLREWKDTKPRARIFFLIIWLAYACACVLYKRTRTSIIIAMIYFVTAVALYLAPKMKAKTVRRMISALAAVSILGSFAVSHLMNSKMMSLYHDLDATDYTAASAMTVFNDFDSDTFYRVSASTSLSEEESGYYSGASTTLGGYNAVSYYTSIIPAEVTEFQKDIDLNTMIYSFCVKDLGQDAAINLLSSVKYMLTKEDSEDVAMPGYKVSETNFDTPDGYLILENEYALPIGYTFDSTMPRSEYDALSPMEKRDALIRAAVVEDDAASLSEPAESQLQQLDVVLTGTNVLSSDNNIEITCTVPGEGEIWVMLGGTEVSDKGSDGRARGSVSGILGSNTFVQSKPSSNFAFGQDGQLIAMGVYPAGETTFTMSLTNSASAKMEMSCENVRVYYRPLETYTEAAQKLGENVLENVEIGTNTVSGTITLSEAKWLQFSIPYSKGWAAEVDGEAVELSASDVQYMGLMLDAGEHTVVLRYTTPYLKQGAVITLVGIVVFTALLAVSKKRKKSIV